MQELIARLGVIFSQLGDQVRAAVENPARRWAPPLM